MKKRSYYLFRVVLGCFLVVAIGCKSSYRTETFEENKSPLRPDYEDEKNWAVLPSTYTKKLKEVTANTTLEADVFYVYPTLINGKKDTRWNVAVDDAEQNDIVLNKAVHFQASAWATSGNVYVPYYRQAHIRSYRMLDDGGNEALMLAYSDIKAAFKVYLEKYNNGRPIIIASHSQGTTHTTLLLKDFFDGKPLQNQLVAAYLIGIGTKKDEFKTIQVMTKPNEIGGFVSWNTYKKNKLPKKYTNWYKGKVASNPITWDTTKTTERAAHKGFLFSNNKIYDKALKLEVIDGMVWTTLPRFPLRVFVIFKKNYHVGDVNLFWKDIQENAELRVKNWLENQQD
jgi:hypothetical protein